MAWNSSFWARNHLSIKFITSREKKKAHSILYSIQTCSGHSSNSFKGQSEGQMCHCSSGLSFTTALLLRNVILKTSPCFFALPCLSKDFTEEFSDASWTYGFFLTSGLSNPIPFLQGWAAACGSDHPWLPTAVPKPWSSVSVAPAGHVVGGSFLQRDWGSASLGNTTSPWGPDKMDSGTFILITALLQCQAVQDRGFSWWLFAFSERWEEYIFFLFPWLTQTISMKRLRWVESIHSNQRDRRVGVKSPSASLPCMSEEFLE